MAKPRRYHPNFVGDLSSATSYYDGIAPDLGNRFKRAVRNKLVAISESPDSFGKIHKEIRAVRTNRFPYVLLYQNTAEMVIVLGIKHGASDPNTWFSTFGSE